MSHYVISFLLPVMNII